MQKWEYRRRTVSVEHGDEIEDLNTVGAEGWELVTSVTYVENGKPISVFYLKRPIPDNVQSIR